jgi:very-short-patch-repair endonuclease
MGNAEETREHRGSVETERGTSARMDDLTEVCKSVHHVRDLAKHYGVSVPEIKAEMKRQGILRHTRREDVDWGDDAELGAKYQQAGSMPALARMLGTTESITYDELRNRGIKLRPRGHLKGQKKSRAWREASAKHWDDPAWRDEQRQKWLQRLPEIRGTGSTSALEESLHESLRKARISFATHQPLLRRFIVDVLITQKPVAVEADGLSHLLKAARGKDAARDAVLQDAGYQVVRFTYRQIADDPDECVAELIRVADLVPEENPVFVISSDAEAMGMLTRQRWQDPEWAEQARAKIAQGQRRRRDREWQMMSQSGLHGPREDMQSYPEMR